MELKEYQQRVLDRFENYLAVLRDQLEKTEEVARIARDRDIDLDIGDWCEKAWKQLNHDGHIPPLRNARGEAVAAPYLPRYDGLERPVPNVCLKVPTGGGKTLLATGAVQRIQSDFFRRQTGLVLWVVPSEAIYRQTWKQLANREHPYRQMLEQASGGRVKLLEKTDAFTRRDVDNRLCVMLLMLPSAARKSKETLRLFRDSGRFTSFFPVEDDGEANRRLLEAVPNLDENDLVDKSYADGVFPGSVSVKQSLGNVLRLVRPVVVIDEGHKAYSDTARGTLCGFNPCFILELSATPNANGRHQSNVLVNVPGTDLKDEEMIKLPINVINEASGGWKHTLTLAQAKQTELERKAKSFQAASGRYIRPIVLVRVERTGKDQRDSAFVHAEDAREYLRDQLGVHDEAIRLKTSETDELSDDDLLAKNCPVRFIVTKDALREGWDCPFAYVLAILSRTTANTALTQMIGRVLRQPHAKLTGNTALDECYVFTFDQDVSDAVDGVRKGLEDEGMADLNAAVRAVDAGTGQPLNMRRETITRRARFANLPRVFLPRVLHRDGDATEGYRPLDYDRDILGELDWETLHLSLAGDFKLEKDKLERTIARVTLDPETRREQQAVEQLPDEGLDVAFLVRQLLDVIPNPWQGMRLLREALDTLRKAGADEAQIYINRLDLVQAMKGDLVRQVNAMAERLFRDKLKRGDISLRLATSHDKALNWEIAETLEIAVSDFDRPLYRKNGNPLERSFFEKVYQREFNDFEKNTAWYLDEGQCVYWWHRIAVNQRSYSLQGWQRNRVYPDFLACIHEARNGKFRFSVLETKGEHLKGNDDTEYKRKLFDLLTQYTDNAVPLGELELDDQSPRLRFTMLMEDGWKQALAEELSEVQILDLEGQVPFDEDYDYKPLRHRKAKE